MRTDWVLLCLQIQTEPFNELIPISALRRGSRQTVDACHPLKILERIERFQGMVGRGDVLSRPTGSFEGEVKRVVHFGIGQKRLRRFGQGLTLEDEIPLPR